MDWDNVRKNKNEKTIQLEYKHDRLMDMKLIQAFQLLVPDKTKVKDATRQTSNVKGDEYADSRDIRKSLLG